MHPIVIPDLATFEDFQNGKQVTVYPLMTQDYLDHVKKGKMRIEVWYKTNMPPNPHHIGKVVSINGPVASIPEGKPDAISMTIRRV